MSSVQGSVMMNDSHKFINDYLSGFGFLDFEISVEFDMVIDFLFTEVSLFEPGHVKDQVPRQGIKNRCLGGRSFLLTLLADQIFNCLGLELVVQHFLQGDSLVVAVVA